MRLDCESTELGKHLDVYVDDELVTHVVWADDVEGAVCQLVLDANGLVQLGYSGTPMKMRREGKVDIYLRPNTPDAVRRAFLQMAGFDLSPDIRRPG